MPPSPCPPLPPGPRSRLPPCPRPPLPPCPRPPLPPCPRPPLPPQPPPWPPWPPWPPPCAAENVLTQDTNDCTHPDTLVYYKCAYPRTIHYTAHHHRPPVVHVNAIVLAHHRRTILNTWQIASTRPIDSQLSTNMSLYLHTQFPFTSFLATLRVTCLCFCAWASTRGATIRGRSGGNFRSRACLVTTTARLVALAKRRPFAPETGSCTIVWRRDFFYVGFTRTFLCITRLCFCAWARTRGATIRGRSGGNFRSRACLLTTAARLVALAKRRPFAPETVSCTNVWRRDFLMWIYRHIPVCYMLVFLCLRPYTRRLHSRPVGRQFAIVSGDRHRTPYRTGQTPTIRPRDSRLENTGAFTSERNVYEITFGWCSGGSGGGGGGCSSRGDCCATTFTALTSNATAAAAKRGRVLGRGQLYHFTFVTGQKAFVCNALGHFDDSIITETCFLSRRSVVNEDTF